ERVYLTVLEFQRLIRVGVANDRNVVLGLPNTARHTGRGIAHQRRLRVGEGHADNLDLDPVIAESAIGAVGTTVIGVPGIPHVTSGGQAYMPTPPIQVMLV